MKNFRLINKYENDSPHFTRFPYETFIHYYFIIDIIKNIKGPSNFQRCLILRYAEKKVLF